VLKFHYLTLLKHFIVVNFRWLQLMVERDPTTQVRSASWRTDPQTTPPVAIQARSISEQSQVRPTWSSRRQKFQTQARASPKLSGNEDQMLGGKGLESGDLELLSACFTFLSHYSLYLFRLNLSLV